MTEEQKRHEYIMSQAMKAKWASSLLRECPHPGVAEKYGTSKVCFWICASCAYAHRYPMHGGISCDYGKDL